jgi:hypothetical protein
MARDNSLPNLYLKVKYILFKKWITPIIWGKPDWEEDFQNPSYTILENFMYNNNSYVSKDAIIPQSDGLHLKVIKLNPPEYREHWSGNFTCYWKCGWVEYHNIFDSPYGTWVINFIPPISGDGEGRVFPALWFLREPYSPKALRFKCGVSKINYKDIKLSETPQRTPGVNWWVLDINNNYIGRVQKYDIIRKIITLDKNIDNVNQSEIYISGDCITPEVDIMEILSDGKFAHTIHYGPTYDEYRKYNIGSNICKPENREYEFAVTLYHDRYEFFIDGIKTCVLDKTKVKCGDEDFVSDQKLYMILNSAVQSGVIDGNIPDFIIKRIRYYKHNLEGNIECS